MLTILLSLFQHCFSKSCCSLYLYFIFFIVVHGFFSVLHLIKLSLLKAIVKSKTKLIAIAFKSKNYRFHDRWESNKKEVMNWYQTPSKVFFIDKIKKPYWLKKEKENSLLYITEIINYHVFSLLWTKIALFQSLYTLFG